MDSLSRALLMASTFTSGVVTLIAAVKYLWSKTPATIENIACYLLLFGTGAGAIISAYFLAKM